VVSQAIATPAESSSRGSGKERFFRLSGCGLILTLTLAACLAPTPALARRSHIFEGTFGSSAQPAFTKPAGMTVDPSNGDLLVIDAVDQTLSRFKPNGEPDPFSSLAGNVIDGHPGEQDATPQGEILSTEIPGNPIEAQVAVAPAGAAGGTAGNIYVTDAFNEEVDVFDSSGKYVGQLSAGFSCGIAVDPSGNVFVGDFYSGVHKFIPSAPAVFGPPSTFAFPEACQVAAGSQPLASGGSQGFVFAARYGGEIVKIDSEGSEEGEIKYTVAPGRNVALGIDPSTGHLYSVPEGATNPIAEYDVSGAASGLKLDDFGVPSDVTGIAPNATSDIFLARSGETKVDVYAAATLVDVTTDGAPQVTETSASVQGTINNESTAVTECFVEYGETPGYGETAPCDSVDGAPISSPSEIPIDDGDHTVTAKLNGLTPNTSYHFRFVAANLSGPESGADMSLETLGPPRVSAESVSEITPSTALIGGLVDPRGEATSFAVEYVSQAEFLVSEYANAATVPVPAKAVGSGVGDVTVSQELVGLSPNTTYHFRLVATNFADPAVHGPDRSFATYPQAEGLADGRAFEMVSPSAKSGEIFPPETSGELGGTCIKCLPGEERPKMPMQPSPDGSSVVYEGQPFHAGLGSESNEYLARRDALSGWTTEGLSRPEYRTVPLDEQATGFVAFSGDLSRGVIVQGEPSLAPDAPPNFPNLYLWQGAATPQPLITKVPPNRASGTGPTGLRVVYGGANSGTASSASFSHVAFEANDALTGATTVAPAAPAVGIAEHDLYEWSGGLLRLVNVLPGNEAAASNAVIGSGHLLEQNPGAEGPVFDHAISADGNRIFWTDKASGKLYVRIDATETREIPDAGGYLTASTDGAKVLLSDGHIYDLETDTTTDLTAGFGGFQGSLGAAEDLSRVYFVDTETLTPPGQENANGEHAEAGNNNLYAWHQGATTFIGALHPSDNRAFGAPERMGTWKPSPSQRTSQVSQDGRFLAFMSAASLTGYDNTLAQSGVCGNTGSQCSEVFEYDASSARLSCASCNPSTERPLGYSNLTLIYNGATAFFPQPQNLTAGGRLFFESQDHLSASDTNGHIQDVYEWEPPIGPGAPAGDNCERAAGCVSLVSSGHSANDSLFLSATPSGSDAFIITREQLLPQQDKDDYLDLYDARIGGGFDVSGAAPCEGEACLGSAPPAPQVQSPGSASFRGPGNRASRKHRRHGKHRKKKRGRHTPVRTASQSRGGVQ
jgi:hypothetical protein